VEQKKEIAIVIHTQFLKMTSLIFLPFGLFTDVLYAQESIQPVSRLGDYLPTLQDGQYKTACGPIACYAALHLLSKTISLDDIARRCNWVRGKLTTLGEMQTALSSMDGIECIAAKVSPQQLCHLLKDDETAIILPVREDTEEIDHAFCVVETQEDDQVAKIIDYPKINRKMLIGELTQIWDGPALIVRVSTARRVLRYFLCSLLPMAASVALFFSIVQWTRGSHWGRGA
jgi:hypothetical protein